LADIGVHLITVVFEGEEISEQEIRIYVFNKELIAGLSDIIFSA